MSEFTSKTPTQEPGYETAMKVVFQWNYDPEVDELRNLYVKATEAQWVAARDLDWEPADRPREVRDDAARHGRADRAHVVLALAARRRRDSS